MAHSLASHVIAVTREFRQIHIMIVDGAQIRGGRAMIGWRRHELAAAANLHWNTVAALEKRQALSTPERKRCHKALARIERALKAEGVLMLSTGDSPGIVLIEI